MSGALREVYDLVCGTRRRQPLYAEPGSPAWNNAWEMLREALPQAGLGDGTDLAQYADEGDCWKYAETRREPPQFVHCFRHRRHPASRRPEELCVYGPPLSLEAPKEERHADDNPTGQPTSRRDRRAHCLAAGVR